MKKLRILSGAGMSAESGISTFRDADGLWEGHDVMSVASPMGWQKDPELVLDFYNQRRRQLFSVAPNAAHEAIAALQNCYDVAVVTQNVDDLHERAGTQRVLHLHGQLRRVRSEQNPALSYVWQDDLHWGDTAEDGAQLRPDIVWFGEDVPLMPQAMQWVGEAEILLVIGTSLQVYPAAGLINDAPAHAQIYYIDPQAAHIRVADSVTCIADTAVSAMQTLLPQLTAQAE